MTDIYKVKPASKGSKTAIITLGLIVAIIGSSVAICWQLYNLNLIPLASYFSRMHFNTAIVFILGGLACVFFMYKWQRISLLLSLAVIIMGFTALLQYITGLNFGIDEFFIKHPFLNENAFPGRMATNSSLCFSVLGIALFIMCHPYRFKYRQISIRLLSTITIGFSMVGFSAWITGANTKGWLEFIRIEGGQTLEMVLLSAAPIVYAWTHCKTYKGTLPPLLPLPTTSAVLLATIFLWQALSGQEKIQFSKTNAAKAEFIKMTLQTNINSRIDYLKQIAKRWDIRGKTPKKEWEIDALSYIDLKSGLKVIEWADSTYHVRWVVPRKGNKAAKDLNILIDPKRSKVLKDLQKQNASSISPIVNLVQGGTGFLAYIPLFPKEKFDGFIIGGFDIKSLFDGILTDEILRDYAISVYDHEKIIYTRDETGKIDKKLPGAVTIISLYGNKWKIVLQPREKLLIEHNTALPAFALFFGIFLGIVVFFGVFFAQSSYLRSRELVKAMRDLNEAKIKTEILLHSIGEGVLEMDAKRKIAFINPIGENMIGFRSENLIGQPLDNFLNLTKNKSQSKNPDDYPIFNVFKDGKIHSANNEIFLRKDGISIHVDYTCAPIRKENKIEGAVLVFRDITTRVRVEAEVKETQKRLKSIMDNATSVIHAKDLDGKYLVVNKRYLELLKIEEKNLIGKTDFDIFPKASAKTYRRSELEVIREKRAINFEEQVFHDGDLHTYVSVKFPLYDAKDNIYAICAIYTDITDRKRSEDKLLDSLKKLEQANKDLKVARMKADEANIAKSTFLANMSHEIRTPLNGVIGMTSLLINSELSEKQERYVSRINLSGKVLLEIINDILDFSKIEAGELQLEKIGFNLRQLVKEIGDLMQIKAEEKQLEFLIRYQPNAPHNFIGDPIRIRQIMTNLASNAIKFTDKGFVLINIEVINKQKNNVVIKCEVQDTGIGIPENKKENIFEKFSQADVSTTRKFGGTGLGLAICKQLVEIMGGKISVVSVLEKGSSFSFEIPLQLDKINSDETVENLNISKLNGVPVIIVDDLENNRNILGEYLQNIGMTPTCFASIEKAEKAIVSASNKNMPYSVALIDHKIGEYSGIELCKTIKSNPKTENIKIIILTTNEQFNSNCDDQNFYFDGLLTKPIDSNELIKTITDIVKT